MPGLMRTFSQYRAATSATRALKWTSATRGVMMPCCFSPSEMLRIFSASRTPCVVSRTSSPPALMMRRAWLMQASVSLVFVVVIDWTRMGESLPIVTLPTWVVVVCLRCMVYGGGWVVALRRLDRRSSDGTMANVRGEVPPWGWVLPCGWVPALRVGACLEGLGWGLLEGSACLAGGACLEGLGWGLP